YPAPGPPRIAGSRGYRHTPQRGIDHTPGLPQAAEKEQDEVPGQVQVQYVRSLQGLLDEFQEDPEKRGGNGHPFVFFAVMAARRPLGMPKKGLLTLIPDE